jgi:predicted HAD superfamily Cof-like phosphohydrolase
MTDLISYCADVRRFKLALNLIVNDSDNPEILDDFQNKLQQKLIVEEVGETINKGIKKRDLIETIDGLGDTLYVTIGAALAFGFRLDRMGLSLPECSDVSQALKPVFSHPDRHTNLLLGACRNVCQAIDIGDVYAVGPALAGMVATIGVILEAWKIPLRPFWNEIQRANMDKVGGEVREDGKRLKPPGWRPPDHMPILTAILIGDVLSTTKGMNE